ncbi:class I adenylate-forming enzyme family protein [Kordia algicida OT-1]|uniref:AMP-dependent synthetase/ligase domain-containing protein n=1 Tax=Kordia algicida OT-1 TaxID=391587 RepID=A9E2N2_9FLAO|nr:class I adenylate-forming enzyme family protein [Kordia algicida]EDP95410.1 hypothetical protein KAOT1_10821 [Kordia algicida OT-1]
MNLHNFIANRKPDAVYLQTEKAAYTYAELFSFVNDFEKEFLSDANEIFALKVKDQALLVFCSWACMIHRKSFVLLPFDIDRNLEERLLTEASCNVLISSKENLSTSFGIGNLTSKRIKSAIVKKEESQISKIGFLSSGTTGKPKLIWNTSQQFGTSLTTTYEHDFMPYTKAQKVLITPFLTHSYGFSALLEYTQGKSTILIPSEASFAGIFRLMGKKEIQAQVTAIEAVPYFYKQLIVFQKKIHFSNLKHIGFGGDFVHDSLLQSLCNAYEDISFSVRYGVSEIPSVIGLNMFTRLEDNTNSYEIHPRYTVTTADEIVVSNNYNATQIATGDIGFMEDERLFVIDRKASFLKVKGYKVSPNFIEKVFIDSGMIQEVHVLTKNDTLIAKLIPLENYDKVGLKNYLRSQLPNYAIPDKIMIVETIERTQTGKIIRQ